VNVGCRDCPVGGKGVSTSQYYTFMAAAQTLKTVGSCRLQRLDGRRRFVPIWAMCVCAARGVHAGSRETREELVFVLTGYAAG